MVNPLTYPWEFSVPGFCGFGLHFQLDGFRLVYTLTAVLMWAVSGVFSGEYMRHYEKRLRYYVFFWVTFLATVGVFLSADLYTTFIFFEIMSLTSYVWVAFDEKAESLRAAETYLAVAIIGGMVMLMGLFLLYDCLGTLEIRQFSSAAAIAVQSGMKNRLYAAGGLLLFGFGAKAGCFPLHIWLPKAHPVAPAPASALLSGILTKTGIFGIIVVSFQLLPGDGVWGVLIAGLGLVTMFLGAFLALFSVNLKRTLACSSVSQIGFILVGIGMSELLLFAGEAPSLAVRGTFLHMLNHSLFKLVLFLCAGAVYMNLHQLELNDIRGFGRNKPCLAFCFLTGAMGISGIPGFSGYVSKTLLHEGIVEYQKVLAEGESLAAGLEPKLAWVLESRGVWTAAEWIFLLTGGMTLAYMLKLFIAVFVERHPTRQAEFDAMSGSYMKLSSKIALCIPAVLLPVMGLFPALTMNRLADLGKWFFLTANASPDGPLVAAGAYPAHGEHPVAYFQWTNLKGGLISIGIGIVLYLAVVRPVLMGRDEAAEDRLEKGKQAAGNAAEHERRYVNRRPRALDGKRYINRWPKALDLENLVYRPLLQVALPGVCGAVCGFIDRYLISSMVSVFLAVFSVVCRAMDHLADGLILLSRKTTHRQVKTAKVLPEHNWLAWGIGELLDFWAGVRAAVSGKKKEMLRANGGRLPSRIPGLMEKEEWLKKTGWMVQESFSFGLMLFCIGLCLTLGYLLYVFFGQ